MQNIGHYAGCVCVISKTCFWFILGKFLCKRQRGDGLSGVKFDFWRKLC